MERFIRLFGAECIDSLVADRDTHRYFFARATAENEDLYVRCTDVLKLYFNGTLVGEGGFEPPKLLAADLQSVPFGHSGIRPDIA